MCVSFGLFAAVCCRYQAYTLGSAFYGIYFLVSYPMFFSLDEDARLGARYVITITISLSLSLTIASL